MLYTELNLPPWMLAALAASVALGTGGAIALQAHDRRRPIAAAAALALAVLVAGAATVAVPRGSAARSWLEVVTPQLVTWTLPALASIVAVAALRRRRAWERAVAGLTLGSAAAFLAVACGLTGDCL